MTGAEGLATFSPMKSIGIVGAALMVANAPVVAGELYFDEAASKIEAAQAAVATKQPEKASDGDTSDLERGIAWGEPGRWWGGVIGGYARSISGPGDSNDFNAAFTLSTFLATRFELLMEFGGWYFNQDGDDALGANFNLLFRWHFLTFGERDDWTVFVDGGAGILGTTENVPPGGTGFNFTPRAGFGFTHRLDESDARLIFGLRWHHISNARIEGDSRNPGRDGAFVYAGVQFPF